MGRFSDILLTVDFDRTLTAPDSTVPERNIRAIEEFMAEGGAFTVNTGRSVPMATRLIQAVPVNVPLLLYNGSADYDVQTKAFTRTCAIGLEPKMLIRDLRKQFPELVLELQGTRAHHIFQKDSGWEAYCENNACAWSYAEADNIPLPFLKLALYGEFRGNTVASTFEANAEDLALFQRATAYLEATYGDKLEIFRPCARILDIHAKGVSKLAAAKLLQRQLGRKILVCVGDAENDVSMLDGADYAFCPSDSVIAGRYPTVCPCAEGAVADVIYKKIPEIVGK